METKIIKTHELKVGDVFWDNAVVVRVDDGSNRFSVMLKDPVTRKVETWPTDRFQNIEIKVKREGVERILNLDAIMGSDHMTNTPEGHDPDGWFRQTITMLIESIRSEERN